LKLTISEKEAEIEALVGEKSKLEMDGENELRKSKHQVDSLRQELHQVENKKFGNDMQRHAEQEAIISELRSRLTQKSVENEMLRNMAGQMTIREKELAWELAEEKRGREYERLAKEKEILNTKTERLNTERERASKEEWQKYSYQLQAEYRWLHRQVERANSLQCDEIGYPGESGQNDSATAGVTGLTIEVPPQPQHISTGHTNHQAPLQGHAHFPGQNFQLPPNHIQQQGSIGHSQAPPLSNHQALPSHAHSQAPHQALPSHTYYQVQPHL
jgi:hypothetical protein